MICCIVLVWSFMLICFKKFQISKFSDLFVISISSERQLKWNKGLVGNCHCHRINRTKEKEFPFWYIFMWQIVRKNMRSNLWQEWDLDMMTFWKGQRPQATWPNCSICAMIWVLWALICCHRLKSLLVVIESCIKCV